MSEENTTSKQPLIRFVNRQQISWRAVEHFVKRWPAKKRRRNIAAAEESWSFATRGSKPN